jgi:hypothetical protein
VGDAHPHTRCHIRRRRKSVRRSARRAGRLRSCGTPCRSSRPLGCRRRRLAGEALLKQSLQAGGRLVLAAQSKELRVAAEPCAQSGRLTADFTVARRGAALEPQVRFTIELILQVMSQCFRRGIVARARACAVADTSGTLRHDHDRVPFASISTDFTLARGEHVRASVSCRSRQMPGRRYRRLIGRCRRRRSTWKSSGSPVAFRFCDAPGVAIPAGERDGTAQTLESPRRSITSWQER